MPITLENQRESIDFMNALNDMLEIIDNIAPLISDNNYLQLCNGYIKYNDEDFDYDKESKKFVYKYDKAIIYNKEVKIVK